MVEKKLSRGFVTIATGSRHYYELAVNLLRSYRRNGGGEWPFAIIAEEQNEHTAEFDKTVLMPEPSHSYMDKLRLFDCLPYDETIFIDADCLVYGCIDTWWDFFKDGNDFSCFGYAYENLKTDKGWFRYESMGEFKDRITFIPSFSGGVYYLRNTQTAARVFELAKYAAAHYREYPFAIFRDPADEPVLAFGMAVCGCRPVDAAEVGIYVKHRDLPMDILAPSAVWHSRGKELPVRLVHWGNFGTMKAQYLSEVRRLRRDLAGKPNTSLLDRLCYILLLPHDALTLWKRICRRLKLLYSTRQVKL